VRAQPGSMPVHSLRTTPLRCKVAGSLWQLGPLADALLQHLCGLWVPVRRRLRVTGVPSIAEALRRPGRSFLSSGGGGVVRGSAGTAAEQEAASGFAAMAAGGNPWRAPRRRSPKQRPPEGGPWRLGCGTIRFAIGC